MKPHSVEYHFLKQSILRFNQDLRQIEGLITNHSLSDGEALEIMAEVVVVKEIIEELEKVYLGSNKPRSDKVMDD